MNKKIFSVIILSGGFGTSMRHLYPDIHKSLIPLGHSPMICILIDTIKDLNNIDDIYILIYEKYLAQFKKEINRWFLNRHNIHIIPQKDPEGTILSMKQFLDLNICKNENLLIFYSNTPLLSKSTVDDFIHNCSLNTEKGCVLVSKLKNRPEYDKLYVKDEMIINEIDELHEYSICNLIYLPKRLFIYASTDFKNDCNFLDLIKSSSYQDFNVYIINPYIANKECIIIKKIEDKNFAEEVYTEYRNTLFIHQCYGLWKKCDYFENRLKWIEDVLSKNNIQ
jgi:choline kinase